jgi:hypothetical protein
MNKLFGISILSLILAGCATQSPYGMGANQGYFLGPANILSNVQNLCVASNNQYAFKAQQYWLAGGTGAVWYGCSAQHTANMQPEYSVDYAIIKNDGTGHNVVSNCEPVYKGNSTTNMHFTQMNVVVHLGNGAPTCQMVLS